MCGGLLLGSLPGPAPAVAGRWLGDAPAAGGRRFIASPAPAAGGRWLIASPAPAVGRWRFGDAPAVAGRRLTTTGPAPAPARGRGRLADGRTSAGRRRTDRPWRRHIEAGRRVVARHRGLVSASAERPLIALIVGWPVSGEPVLGLVWLRMPGGVRPAPPTWLVPVGHVAQGIGRP
ncbi:MAG: hypothetical protein HKP61_12870 [Dactylosporangium sp.]|nr:hypothetical protein [Dactylosporangium sp.]